MLLVVFGAGASYDSVPHRPVDPPQWQPYRPPLANQLFEDRPLFVEAMSRFPQCQPVIPDLRNVSPTVGVEQVLSRFESEATSYPERHKQLAAIKYYLRYALLECQRLWGLEHKGITCYKTLLDQIEKWRCVTGERVCLVTFNYDTMLEEALREFFHLELQHLDHYLFEHVGYMLIKLHGSVNWGREVASSFAPGTVPTTHLLIENAAKLKISKQYRLINSSEMLVEEGHVVFPALAIPVESKDSFECPDYHVKALHDSLLEVTKILTIGWRAREADFLEMLQTLGPRPRQLMVVSGNERCAQETHRNLAGRGMGLTKLVLGNGGFTELIRSREVETFLKG
jgi:hypothetical protein